jgi:hypothetical protein
LDTKLYPAPFISAVAKVFFAASRKRVLVPVERPGMIYVDALPDAERVSLLERIAYVPDAVLVKLGLHPRLKVCRASVFTDEIHRRDVLEFGAVEMYSTHYHKTRTARHMQVMDDERWPFGVARFAGLRGYYANGLPSDYPLVGNPHERVWFWGSWFEIVNGEALEVEYGTPFLQMFAHLLK